jgi:thiol-disulfide isomerase/thioredoxin
MTSAPFTTLRLKQISAYASCSLLLLTLAACAQTPNVAAQPKRPAVTASPSSPKPAPVRPAQTTAPTLPAAAAKPIEKGLPTPALSLASKRAAHYPLVVFPSARPVLPPPTGKVGTPAAAFSLLTPAGSRVAFPQAARGQPTVLLFWPSWCPYSRALQPYLQSIASDYASRGVNVWTVNIDETGDPVAALRERGITLPVLLDGNAVADQYGVRLTATVKLIDSRGIVSYSTGEAAASPVEIAKQLRDALNTLLGSRAVPLPESYPLPYDFHLLSPAAEDSRKAPAPIAQKVWLPWVERYLATLQQGEQRQEIPAYGTVTDGKQAIGIARAVWSQQFGAEQTLIQAPYRSYRVDNHWVVLASGGSGASAQLGEGFILVLAVDSGQVIRVARELVASKPVAEPLASAAAVPTR